MPNSEPVCPKCGYHILQEIDCTDIENNISEIICHCIGWCPHCDAVFKYKNIFKHHHVEVNQTPED